MSTQPLLSVESVAASYGKYTVFDNVSLSIDSGEIFGLIGLNGVGKTTLIKLIMGLRDSEAGDVTFSEGSEFSYLPERFEPPWFLTGYEFIKFSLALYDKKITFDEATAEAKKVSLNPDFLKKKVQTYSKGMRQKLGLLATVLSGSSLLILDEPMSGLDPKARDEIKELIVSTKKEGRSIFMSSHILSDMHELCDRVAVFNGGSVVFLGAPAELLKEGRSKSLEKAFLKVIDKAL